MSESPSVRELPPVPGWERLAAGLLVVAWVGFFCATGSPREWYLLHWSYVGALHNGWQSFLREPTGDVFAVFNSIPLLEGIISGLWLVAWGGMPVLIVGALAVASGRCLRRHRRWLWWLALGNGALCGLALLFQSRHFVAMKAPLLQGSRSLSWHEGWLDYFTRETLPFVAWAYWPFAAQMLLAALVLGVGWWSRKRCLGGTRSRASTIAW